MADTIGGFENYADDGNSPVYVLRLFIIGASPNSIRAVENVKAVCEKYISGQYELDIIDVHQQPQLAQGEDLIALPMLVKKAPGTQRRLIGDMSDTTKVLKGLGLADAM